MCCMQSRRREQAELGETIQPWLFRPGLVYHPLAANAALSSTSRSSGVIGRGRA